MQAAVAIISVSRSIYNKLYFHCHVIYISKIKVIVFVFVFVNGVLGMVKYAAVRSGCKYVVGREVWKSMVVNKLMYGYGLWHSTGLNAMIWK